MGAEAFVTHANRMARLLGNSDVFEPPLVYMKRMEEALREEGDEEMAAVVENQRIALLNWRAEISEGMSDLMDDLSDMTKPRERNIYMRVKPKTPK